MARLGPAELGRAPVLLWAAMFFPFEQDPDSDTTLVVRSRMAEAELAPKDGSVGSYARGDGGIWISDVLSFEAHAGVWHSRGARSSAGPRDAFGVGADTDFTAGRFDGWIGARGIGQPVVGPGCV